MKQAAFEQAHAADWEALEETLERLESRDKRIPHSELSAFGARYRRLVRHHALAVERYYSIALTDRLQALLRRSYLQLYRNRELLPARILHFIGIGFPAAVRRHARLFWLAAALFYLPALLVGLWCYGQDDAIYSVLDPQQVAQLEYAYDPTTEHPGRGEARQSSTDIQMFGYYIANNTGIGFRAYASGLVFGIGSVFIILYNGLVIGASAGHLTGLGFGQTFWPFVCGHSAFELTAICISGAAGLLLGSALLFPSRRRRVDALRRAATASVPLITGAAMFFFIAAFIEAFWSSSMLPASIKYLVAAGLWAAVTAYLTLAGRGRDAA